MNKKRIVFLMLAFVPCSCARRRDISYEIVNQTGVCIDTVSFKTQTMNRWWGAGANIVDGGKATQTQRIGEPISRADFYGVYQIKYVLEGRKEKVSKVVDASDVKGSDYSLRFVFSKDSIRVEKGN